jgi:hypothetical protein
MPWWLAGKLVVDGVTAGCDCGLVEFGWSEPLFECPMPIGHSWLSHFSGDPWHLCFLEGAEGPVVAAFIGVRTEGFFAGMHDHGLVVSVHT